MRSHFARAHMAWGARVALRRPARNRLKIVVRREGTVSNQLLESRRLTRQDGGDPSSICSGARRGGISLCSAHRIVIWNYNCWGFIYWFITKISWMLPTYAPHLLIALWIFFGVVLLVLIWDKRFWEKRIRLLSHVTTTRDQIYAAQRGILT